MTLALVGGLYGRRANSTQVNPTQAKPSEAKSSEAKPLCPCLQVYHINQHKPQRNGTEDKISKLLHLSFRTLDHT
ncbi:hypothetical protein Pmani_019637 [Petrolisthes manimaculis]|uniref:Uncharacterized protein n=1 Tax=Petrolisthes manimaculis TaxID=1843537 RepID=A0AAE1PI46_9EUCA|nr:hypothetical protein Pmani_019637 [Petrolisthes manimaculis]